MTTSRKYKRTTSTTEEDTMAIDVANVSDDVFYDRRNLRESLNNSDSLRTGSRSSSTSSSHENERQGSSGTIVTSNKNARSPSPPDRSKNNTKVQNEEIVDVPHFEDISERESSDNSDVPSNEYLYTKYVSRVSGESCLRGSHFDWEGDGITVASSEVGLKSSEDGPAIIVHDTTAKRGEDKGGRMNEGGPPSRRQQRASLGLDMPVFSKVSGQSSRMFESLWGDTTDDDSMYSNSAGSKERKSVLRNCVWRVKNHGKMVLICVALLVILVAVIGVLTVMIPMWLQSGERGESAELGGLAYGEGDGVMMDNSGSIASSEEEASATSKLVISSPPYNIDLLCDQESLLKDGGYDECVSACLPSRCCLVEDSKAYEVWALHIGANDIEEIGKSIPSCLKDNKDLCIRYKQACGALGSDSLLPIKPPSSSEVSAMNDVEKLDLAEKIIRACSPRFTDGLAECQALCETKACCFVKDIEEDETVRVTDTGESSILATPVNITGSKFITENGDRKLLRYCGNDPKQFCLTYAGCEPYFH
jgi:hypothetical protein